MATSRLGLVLLLGAVIATAHADETPDAWEQRVLAEFDLRAAQGENLETLGHVEIVDEPQGRYLRYIKAIPVQPLCLTCHGPAEATPAHDYNGRRVSTIGKEKALNPRIAGKTREAFIEIMNHLNLPMPEKIAEAVPANLRGGEL